MGFVGYISAVINKKAREERKQHKAASFNQVKTYHNIYGKLIDHKKMSAEEFESFKHELQVKEKTRQKKFYIVFVITILLVGISIFFFFFY